jgi:hypothetical protein
LQPRTKPLKIPRASIYTNADDINEFETLSGKNSFKKPKR